MNIGSFGGSWSEFPDMQDIASFHRWVHPVNRAERYLVLPDGCRDVLCQPGLMFGLGWSICSPAPRSQAIGCARARA